MPNTDQPILSQLLKQLQSKSLRFGAIGVAIMLAAWITGSDNFYQSYLVGWLFAMGFALGGLLIVCIHNLAHGGWGFLIRRIGEASALTIFPLMLLFLPILFSMDNLYPWAMKDAAGALVYGDDPIVGSKLRYLNVNGMWLRYVIYLVIWSGAALLFKTMSDKQDETGDIVWRRRMRAFAGPMALVYVLTVTFFSVDTIMSIEPKWFSSIFGVIVAAGHMLTILTTGILLLTFLSRWEPIKSEFTIERQHDLGKLLFAFVIFWTYTEVSQLVIYWHANLPEEISWFMNRWHPHYNGLSWFLVMAQFVIPFLVLISRGTKRNTKALAISAGFLLFMRVIDLFWMVGPAIHQPATPDLYPVATKAMSSAPFHFMDLLSPVSFGLLWFGLFLRQYRQRPLLPVHDPFFCKPAPAAEKEAA